MWCSEEYQDIAGNKGNAPLAFLASGFGGSTPIQDSYSAFQFFFVPANLPSFFIASFSFTLLIK